MVSKNEIICVVATITSKINGTPKGVYFLISKLHSILAVANLLAHNNKSQICYCSQISLQSDVVNCSFSDSLTPLGVTLILPETNKIPKIFKISKLYYYKSVKYAKYS